MRDTELPAPPIASFTKTVPQNATGKLLAQRFGGKWESYARILSRLRTDRQRFISRDLVDKLCTLFERSPEEFYGDQW